MRGWTLQGGCLESTSGLDFQGDEEWNVFLSRLGFDPKAARSPHADGEDGPDFCIEVYTARWGVKTPLADWLVAVEVGGSTTDVILCPSLTELLCALRMLEPLVNAGRLQFTYERKY